MRHANRPAMTEVLQYSVPQEVKDATEALAARDALTPSEIVRRAVVKELRAVGILPNVERADERRIIAD